MSFYSLYCLFGFHIVEYTEKCGIHAFLSDHLKSVCSEMTTVPISSSSLHDCKQLVQVLQILNLPGRVENADDAIKCICDVYLPLLMKKLSLTGSPEGERTQRKSASEARYSKTIHHLVMGRTNKVIVTFNQDLFGFESDVVVSTNQNQVLLNIELDGGPHAYPVKKRFCELRDKVLQSKGVQVLRINTRKVPMSGLQKIVDEVVLPLIRT